MKKIFVTLTAFAATIAATTIANAQLSVPNSVVYYGVDFSKAKVFGAAESAWEFKNAFNAINTLVITEWPKYNPGHFLDKNIVHRDILPTAKLNEAMNPANIIIFSPDYYIPKDEVAQMVRNYDLHEKEGTGLVIICEMLDKSTYMGTFIVVYFDVATREVLHGHGIMGKARGFGLRNYWAGALHRALKG